MEKYLQIGATAAALIGSIYAGGVVVHSHATETVDRVRATAEQYAEMNQAEFKLYITKQELKYQMIKPAPQRSEYENMQIDFLVEEQKHWSGRVRDLEATAPQRK